MTKIRQTPKYYIINGERISKDLIKYAKSLERSIKRKIKIIDEKSPKQDSYRKKKSLNTSHATRKLKVQNIRNKASLYEQIKYYEKQRTELYEKPRKLKSSSILPKTLRKQIDKINTEMLNQITQAKEQFKVSSFMPDLVKLKRYRDNIMESIRYSFPSELSSKLNDMIKNMSYEQFDKFWRNAPYELITFVGSPKTSGFEFNEMSKKYTDITGVIMRL